MHKTILYMAISLDGFVAGKNDDISWLFRYNDVDYGFDEFFATVGAIIQGRRAYDIELQHGWTYAHPLPTFVMTHRLPEQRPPRAELHFTSEDVEVVLKRAREMTDKDIWIEGGANIAQQFLYRGLIDEIVLSIAPVILGDGIALFGKSAVPRELTLLETRRFDKGLVQLRYV